VGYVQFPYDLGGVRTGYKIQGATRPRLTCNLNPRPGGCRTNLDLRSLFVSISRVNSIDNIRIVPLINGDRSKLDYMRKFSMDPKVRLLPRCYNERGEWIATTNDIVKWFDEYGIEWRPKPTLKHPLNDFQKGINESYPRLSSPSRTTTCKKRINDNNVLTPQKKLRCTSSGEKSPRKRIQFDCHSSSNTRSPARSRNLIPDSSVATPQRTSSSLSSNDGNSMFR